jgi:hypothetical protein
MLGKGMMLALLAAVAVAAGPAPLSVRVAYAACEPGEKIDATTADQARKKIEAAGYRKVTQLKKGCDNVWHGMAEKGGATVSVALTPQGEVYPERD